MFEHPDLERVRVDLDLSIVQGSVRCGVDEGDVDDLDAESLESLLSRHPKETIVTRVRGYSLSGAGIMPGDFLVLDRDEEPIDGDVVVAILDDGGLTAKRYYGGSLVSDTKDEPPMVVKGTRCAVVVGHIRSRRWLREPEWRSEQWQQDRSVELLVVEPVPDVELERVRTEDIEAAVRRYLLEPGALDRIVDLVASEMDGRWKG